MKDILNKTIKVKHLVVLFVLIFALKFVAVKSHRNFNHKRFAQKEWVKSDIKRGNFRHDSRPEFRRGNFRHDIKKLSDVEKASVDSLKSLFVKGDKENNMVIFKQIRGIVKK